MSVAHVLLREWESRAPSKRPDDALCGRTLDDAGRRLAVALADAKMLDVRELRDGLSVQAFSHVGRVRLGDLTVTVTPKLDADTLLTLFSYAYGVRNVARRGRAEFSMEGPLLQELMVEMLHDELEGLLRRGLPKRYRVRREELVSPRGRIDVMALATRGEFQATLPCEHHLRSEDWGVHQVLLGGLRLAASLTATTALRVRLLRLAAQLDERVSTIELHGRAITEAIRGLDRVTRVCEPALRLVEALYEGQMLSLLEAQPSVSFPGFLFDMNRFFQALLSRFLSENLAGHEVVDEHQLRGLMRYAPDANPRRRQAPTPRPDFAIRDGGRVVALLDAKYRDLWARTLPREMLYQLAIYALSQPAGSLATATILYPTTDVAARDAKIDLGYPLGGWGRAAVVLRPVALHTLREIVRAEETTPVRKKRQEFARRLVFGAA